MSLKKEPEPIKHPSSTEDKDIRDKITKERHQINRAEDKIQQLDNRIQKVVQSNSRNAARLLRHKARLQELYRSREHPEILLTFSGIMNEYVQTFMISHNFQINVDVTSMNPDHMSYEQLIELGEKIGKVSKGLNKEEIEKLKHVKIHRKDEPCPICCTEFSMGDLGIQLRCKHIYHDECITEWFKDENNCPICKQPVMEKMEEEKMGKY